MPPVIPSTRHARPPSPAPPLLPRIITYYQTHHDQDGNLISVLPLVNQPGISLTHLILAAIHINEDPAALTLNDHHPGHARFTTLWAELRVLQAAGVKVLGMLGGAAKGSFARLDGDPAVFERYYAPLRDLVRERALDGLDLDVEEETSLAGIVRLVDRLRADFGPAFLITLAPVAAALLDARANLSGFDYEALEVMRGHEIAWYNAQFYCGWGDCSSPVMWEMMLAKGWPAEKIVVGLVTNPDNGSGWVPWEVLMNLFPALLSRNPRFGGVMGWEYFNSLPGGREAPWEWARWMTAVLRGEKAVLADVTNKEGGGRAEAIPPPLEEMKKEEYQLRQRGAGGSGGEIDPDEDNGQDAPLPTGFEYHSDGLVEDD